MKKYIVLLAVVVLIVSAVLLGALSFLTYEVTKEPDACTRTSLTVSPAGEAGSLGTLTVKGVRATPEQLQNAEIIVSVAAKENLPARAAEVAIMTAIVESELINVPFGYPGSTSLGLFQQIAAWGPRKVRMNPALSAQMFYLGGRQGQRGLTDVPNWQGLDRGVAAQEVQRSAYPDEYAKREAEAIAIVSELLGVATTVQTAQECEDWKDPIEVMVQAMESKVGQSVAAIGATESSFRIGTYNVHGSNHTGHDSAMQRAVTQSALIKDRLLGVVGVQELRPDQRNRLMELLGDSYDIYPKTEIYGAKQTSANSIIVDTSQFKYISDRSTPMPFYFGGQELDIPLVELQHIDSGLEITVINTHDPAKPIYDRLRYLNAEAHAELVDRLAAQGKTVFFTGDFNSGFKVRGSGNTTYQNLRPNLTWCIMTRSGVQINGYDDALGRTGCSEQTTKDLGEGPVDHVYVPRDGVSTVNHTIVREGTASDHPLVYVDMAVGDDDAVETGAVQTSPQLISWAADQGGFSLPAGYEALSNFTKNAEGDVTGEFISSESIASGTPLDRGDLVVLKNKKMGVFRGNADAGPSFRVSTWNIQIGTGYQARVDRAHQRIKQDSLAIVGFQEVENKAMFDALAAKSGLGDRYAIYPENPKVVAHGWIGARPIVYDTTRFEKVEGSSFSFPRMHLDHPEKQPVDFPLLRLRDRLTGKEFAVMNVHFAAFKRYAKERYESGIATVDVVEDLVDDGTPVVLTGDFNSNYFLRMDSPNPTYQGERDNMAYCQFTAGGLMNNARDLAETDPRFTPGSYCPRTQADGGFSVDHIYLSSHFDVPDGGFGEVTDTLSDHGTAPYADVVIAGTQHAEPGLPGLGSYVGLDGEGATVKSLTLKQGQLLGAIRLSVVAPGLQAGEWVFPLPAGTYNYSSPYGPRELGSDDFHNGADFGTQGVEVPLVAMHDGTVIGGGYKGAWGNYLLVETNIPVPDSSGETYKYMYAHMSRYALGVAFNSKVEAGQTVGNVGNTGNSFGQHLHLNICTSMDCLSGNEAGAIDPIPFMEGLGIWP